MTTKLVTQHQAWWSEYLSQLNMVIHFHPGKLGAKPDTLTRWWDIYRKGEIATSPQQIQAICTLYSPMSNLPPHYRLLILWPQFFNQPLLWTLNNFIILYENPTPLTPLLLRNPRAPPTPNGPLMTMVYYAAMTASTCQMLMTFDSKFCSTSTITSCQDTSAKIKPSN